MKKTPEELIKLREKKPRQFAYPMDAREVDGKIVERSVTGRIYVRDPKTGVLRRVK